VREASFENVVANK